MLVVPPFYENFGKRLIKSPRIFWGDTGIALHLGATAPGGWAYDYGKGRVCYLSPGHLLTVLWNPEYIKVQQNAVRWIMRRKA